MRKFVHLHAHSEYSKKDGAGFIKDIIAKMKAEPEVYGKAFAITDHGTMSAVAIASQMAEQAGLEFICGTEAYVCPDRFERTPESYHLILLAMNRTGYMNLCRLSSESYLTGFYRYPRVDYELLRQHNEGIIALSACMGGDPTQQILRGDYPKAKERALMYADIFPGRYYLEIQQHYIEEGEGVEMSGQNQGNEGILRLHRETGIPLVATNDFHYVTQDMARAQTMVMGINFNHTMDMWPEDRFMLGSDQFYMKTADEMHQAIGDIPGIRPEELEAAIHNTTYIADLCEKNLVKFERWHLPQMHKPKGITGQHLLWTGIVEGQARRYDFTDVPADPETGKIAPTPAQIVDAKVTFGLVNPEDEAMKAKAATLPADKRADVEGRMARAAELYYEFRVINKMGFSDYMLIVWNLVAYARGHHIPTGPGRGSAAGSRIAFATGITDVNPLRHHLLFERFLNEDRVSMPDIDLDFCKIRRGEVIQYIKDLYGEDKVAQIGTNMIVKAKSAIQDMGRFMGIPKATVDRITKMLPEAGFEDALEASDDEEADITKLEDFLKDKADELAALIKEDKKVADLLRYAQKIEGTVRATGMHAAGVLIGDVNLMTESGIPLMINNATDRMIHTQFDMNAVGDLGWLKMDALGLRTETVKDMVIKNVLAGGYSDEIKRQVVLPPDQLEAIPGVSEKTYEIISTGETIGVFQLESRGMRGLMQKIKPQTFEELSDGIALFRPGPIQSGMMDQYTGDMEKVHWPEDVLPVLGRTRQILIYQEQVMQLAQVYAGYSLKEADNLRRIIGKKNMDKMAKSKGEFVRRAKEMGRSENQASDIFDMVAKFAGYGFNASHSMAYGYIAYHTAYFKANFPFEYFAAVLSSVDDTKKLSSYIGAAKQYLAKAKRLKESKIIAPADINKAGYQFKVEYGKTQDGDLVPLKLVFGLGSLKSVQRQDVGDILAERADGGPFLDFDNFMKRVGAYRAARLGKKTAKVNKKTLLGLIIGGAFDSFDTQGDWMKHRYELLKLTGNEGISMPTEVVGGDMAKKNVNVHIDDLDEDMWCKIEKEYLQTPVVATAKIDRIWGKVQYQITDTSKSILEKDERTLTWVGGVLKTSRFMKTKNGKAMWRGSVEDITGEVSLSLFGNEVYLLEEQLKAMNRDDGIIVRGQVNNYNGEAGMIITDIYPLSLGEHCSELVTNDSPELRKRLTTILKNCERGEVKLYVRTKDSMLIDLDVSVSLRGLDKFVNEISNHGLHRRNARAS